MANEEKDLIIRIQEEIQQQRKIGGIWRGFCNLQKLASGDIWESSTRYVYELLQNAEDAGAREFKVEISKKGAKLIHNGNLFTKDDVRNVCYAVSEKDPNETIGYLGVGFRSVFTVTDKPEIYSEKYMFRFDKEECLRKFNDTSLFYFYPYWIEQPTEEIGREKTTFILPFKSEEFFTKSIEQLQKLGVHSLLFLRNIKSISINNTDENTSRVCNITYVKDLKSLPEHENIKVGKLQLVEGSIATRFLVFRGTFKVLPEIREDEETKRAKREKITEREVSIAIRLDEQDNLKPIDGYVCSFFPIKERRINFLVHADFIVQAGRVALLDNKWNKWLMGKARELSEICYRYFQENPEESKWVEQSPSIFEKRGEAEGDIYYDVFEKPLYEVTQNPILICIEGERIHLNEAARITEETDELVKKRFIKCADLEMILPSEGKYHLIRKDYPTGDRLISELKVDNLNSEEFIRKKIEEGKGSEFLTSFYVVYKKAMERRYAHSKQSLQEEFIKSDLGSLLVIDREGNVKKQDEVWIEPDLEIFNELKRRGIEIQRQQILSEYNLIDKKLHEQAKEYLPKVGEITKEDIIEKGVLPKIKTSSEKPRKEDLLSWTYLLKYYGRSPKEEIWVIDATDQIRKSSEVFLSDGYEPLYRWQKFSLPDMNFLSEEYLNLDNDPDSWKKIFNGTLMKGDDSSDYRQYIENAIYPILSNKEKIKKLPKSKIISYTRAMVECDFKPGSEIFIVTRDESIERTDSEIYFPSQYSPKQKWENQRIINFKFVSPEYPEHIDKIDEVNIWKEFFKKLGVKEEAPDEMIAEFGKAIVWKEFHERKGYKVEPYGGKGGDLKATKDDEILYIEVKSRSSGDVNDEHFDSKKAKFVQEKGEMYYLAKVINIPDAPIIYLLKDPAHCEGVTTEMNIPGSTIENYSEKIDARDWVK